MVGSVTYATLGLVEWVAWLWHPNFLEGIGFVYNRVGWPLFLLGAMAAVAALHVLQRESYGLRGASASLAAFVGLALMLSRSFVGPVREVFLLGLLVAAVGIVILGMATLEAGVLPWWCGAALIAGSPLVGFLLYLFSELAWLLGVAWALVGFAIFRAGTRHTEQPSRVR